MKRPPNLNRRMILQSTQNTADGGGGFVEGWQTLGTLWAEVRARGGRAFAHDEVAASAARPLIIVRAASPGSPSRPIAGQRLVEGTRIFTILSVRDHDQTGRYLALLTQEETAA